MIKKVTLITGSNKRIGFDPPNNWHTIRTVYETNFFWCDPGCTSFSKLIEKI